LSIDHSVALVRYPAALEDDCRSADIVIAPFTIGKRCRTVIIDRRMLRAEGTYALYMERLSIRAASVAEACGRRPWVLDRTVVRTAPPTSPTQNDEEGGANSRATMAIQKT